MLTVKIGQVWQDWDARYRSQTPSFKTIEFLDGEYAHVKCSSSGRRTKILLKRFRENSTGYKLIVKDIPHAT